MPAIKTIERTVELGGNVAQSSFPDPVPAYFFNDETAAHIFVIHARKDGQPFSFTGNVSAVFLNDIGTTVTFSGSLQDGAARVTLSDACYQVSGSFTLTISVSGAVVYECCGTIKCRSSSTAYDPTGEIGVAALGAKISEMETATAEAKAAADATEKVGDEYRAAIKPMYTKIDYFSLEFVRGESIGIADGSTVQDSKRVRTRNINTSKDQYAIIVSNNPDISYRVAMYHTDPSFGFDGFLTDWTNKQTILEGGYIYRLTIRRDSEKEETVSDETYDLIVNDIKSELYALKIDESNHSMVSRSNKNVVVIDDYSSVRIKNVDTTAESFVCSNKNVIPDNNNGTGTKNGITWTQNSDGTIVFNGTANSSGFTYEFKSASKFEISNVIYTLSCGLNGDRYNETDADGNKRVPFAMCLAIYNETYPSQNAWTRQLNDFGDGVTFYAKSDHFYRIWFRIYPGTTVDNLMIAPQLEIGRQKTAFVKPEKVTYLKSESRYTFDSFPDNLVIYSIDYSPISVSFSGIRKQIESETESDAKLRCKLAGGTENEDHKSIFSRINRLALDWKRVFDVNMLSSENVSHIGARNVLEEHIGIGYRLQWNGTAQKRVVFTYGSPISVFKNIKLKAYADNVAWINQCVIEFVDTNNRYASYHLENKLHDGMNYIVDNLYYANKNAGFDPGNVKQIIFLCSGKSDNATSTLILSSIDTYKTRAMCSIESDDGSRDFYTFVLPTLKEKDFKAVVAISEGKEGLPYYMTREQIKGCVAAEFDVMSHGKDQTNMFTVDMNIDETIYQIDKNIDYLMRLGAGRAAFYIALQNGASVTIDGTQRWYKECITDVVKEYCSVLKNADTDYNIIPMFDNMNFHSVTCFSELAPHVGRPKTVADAKAYIDTAIEYGLWICLGFHNFVDVENDPYCWAKSKFVELIDYLDNQRESIDVVTYSGGFDKM